MARGRTIGVLLERRSVRARIPIPGVGVLGYASDRTPRRVAEPVVRVPLLGSEVPRGLKAVDVEVTIGDQTWHQTLDPAPFLRMEQVVGEGPINVRHHVRVAVRHQGGDLAERTVVVPLGPWDPRVLGLGGWQLAFQHHLEPETGTVLLANGTDQPVVPEATDGGWVVELTDRGERLTFDREGRIQSIDDLLTGRRRVTVDYEGRSMRRAEVGDGTEIVLRQDADRALTILHARGEASFRFGDGNWLGSVAIAPQAHTTVVHDEWGGLTSLTSPDGDASTVQYSADGAVETIVDPVGRRDIVVSRDGTTRRYALVHSDGRESTLAWSRHADGTVTRVSHCCGSPAAVTTHTRPDGSRTVELADGTSIHTSWQRAHSELWGTAGPVVKERRMITPHGAERVIRRWRESTGPLTREVLEIDGRRDVRVHERSTSTTRRTTPAGRITEIEGDELGRPRRLGFPDRPAVELSYDTNGALSMLDIGDLTVQAELVDDGIVRLRVDGDETLMTFDPTTGLGHRAGPDGHRRGTTVADDGSLVIDADDHAVLTVATDRSITRISFPATATGTGTIAIERDASGNQVSITEPHGALALRRDDAGRLVGIAAGDDEIVYARDSLGRVVEATTNHGEVTRFELDGPRLLTEIAEGRASARVEHRWEGLRWAGYRVGDTEVAVDADPDDRPTRVGPVEIAVDPDSGQVVERRLGRVTVRYAYDHHHRLVSVQASGDGGVALFGYTDALDARGRTLTRTETVGGDTAHLEYRYDSGGRLAAVLEAGQTVWRASHDGRGNRTQLWRGDEYVETTIDGRDRLVQVGDTRFTYDDSDRLHTADGPDGTTHHGYDGFGRLALVEGSFGRVQYAHDGLGRRVARFLDGVQTHGYVWSGRRLFAVVDPTGGLDQFFFYGHGRTPIAVMRANRIELLVTDQLGTPRATIDPATAQLTGRLETDPDGRVVHDSLGLSLGHAGGLVDPMTGLIEHGHRSYDPELARWTRRDPRLSTAILTNLHAYCSGDPINRIDPHGLQDSGSGVSVCSNEWLGVLDHGSVKVGDRVYGWDPSVDRSKWTDQTAAKARDKTFECEEVPDVDPECVMAQIQDAAGNFRGVSSIDTPYIPPINTCWNPVYDAIANCGGDPYEATPVDEDSLWDRFTKEVLYPATDVLNEITEGVLGYGSDG